MKLLDFAVRDGQFFAGADCGKGVRAEIAGPVGTIESRVGPDCPYLSFAGGSFFLRHHDGSLHAGEILGIRCNRMAAESVWRQLTGEAAPQASPVCPIHEMATLPISPGVFGCEKCVAAATPAGVTPNVA